MLDAERLVAIHYALPPRRRAATLRDGVWAYHVGHVEAEMPAALREVEALVFETRTSELGYAIALGALR